MKTILLIEDSTDIRETTAEILELANYQVFTAENGKIGCEIALEHRPDLVICDIMMPVLDGYGVLHVFNQNPQLYGIPFIFLTAKTERDDFRKGMEMGADDYITKPFQEIELLNAIESRLKKAENMATAYKNSTKEIDDLYFEAQNHTDLHSLSVDRKVSAVKKKQVIYSEGDEATKFYFLKHGKVKSYQTNKDGKSFITALYNEGDFFGYLSLIENTEHNDTAEALSDAEIIAIPKHDFWELISKNTVVATKFIKLLANNIQEREKNLLSIAYNSLRKRVAEALITLQNKYDSNNGAPFSMKISRDDLASVVGTATESLIRTLSDFKAEKLIEIAGSEITLVAVDKLKNLRN